MFVHMDQILRVTHNHQHNNRRRGTRDERGDTDASDPHMKAVDAQGVTGHIDSVHTEGRFHRNL